ncbi:MAG: thioredoxin domain-containing protein [Hyphomonadaceae bacterium]
MIASRRSLLLLAGSAALVLGCTGSEATPSNETDMTIGAENAPVHLIEYASATCPHCREFHETVWPTLKANYIDTGKVRFTFREMATAPPEVAVAMFQLARCGGANADTYLTRLGVLFEQQRTILGTGTMGGVRDSLIAIGQASNLSQDQVMGCITDAAGAERVRASAEEANSRFGVTGTPAFILNGERVTDTSVTTLEGMTRILDAALAQHGG